jgi:dUTPase
MDNSINNTKTSVKLDYVKFFDVKSPKGVIDKAHDDGKIIDHSYDFSSITYYDIDWSIGVDLYMPRPTQAFIIELFKTFCKKVHVNEAQLSIWSSDNISKAYKYNYAHNKGESWPTDILTGNLEFCITVERYRKVIEFNFLKYLYSIYTDIQIPMGIGFDIPEGYYLVVDSKSGSFSKGFTIVPGKIDENYTYGTGAQILLIDNLPITIKPDEKVEQLILKKAEYIGVMNELSMEDYEKIPRVQERRRVRTGGFGSTDKKD